MDEYITPDQILDTNDRGDDTQLRFRYQNACACYMSILLLSDDCQYSEVYCELHEDILIKTKDNKYIGVQIKTQDASQGAFKIKDLAIIKALMKFVKLDIKFPNMFNMFVIVSNVGFDKTLTGDNKSLIDNETEIDLSKNTDKSKLIKNIATTINCSNDKVIEAIKKVRIRKPMPQLADIDEKLISTLCNQKETQTTYPRVIKEIVDRLILMHYNASSLCFDTEPYDNYLFNKDISNPELVSKIESKRITKQKVLDIIYSCIDNQELITPLNNESILNFTPSTLILEKKLDAGNINIENRNILKEDKFAFEHLMTERYYKDEARANAEYNNCRLMMLNECQDSYDRFDKTTTFGMPMLFDVKDRIKNRIQNDKEHTCGCTYEHLLGLVAVLTEECKVWWSDKFEI